MNIEQLKLILDTFSAAGEGGKELFLWWLAMGFIGDLGVFLCVAGLFVGCYKLGKGALENAYFTNKVATVMDQSGGFYESSQRRVLDILKKHREENKR